MSNNTSENNSPMMTCFLKDVKMEIHVVLSFPSQGYYINSIICFLVNIILTLSTIIINSLTVLAYWKSSQLKKKCYYFLVMLLSLNDLGVGVLSNSTFTVFLAAEILGHGNCVFVQVFAPFTFLGFMLPQVARKLFGNFSAILLILRAKWIYSDSSEHDENVAVGPVERATPTGADLRTPKKAEIAKERKIQTNFGNLKRCKRGSKDPKHVSSWERVEQYKNEYLTVVNGKLRCDACKEFISKKKSSIAKHVQSRKHT